MDFEEINLVIPCLEMAHDGGYTDLQAPQVRAAAMLAAGRAPVPARWAWLRAPQGRASAGGRQGAGARLRAVPAAALRRAWRPSPPNTCARLVHHLSTALGPARVQNTLQL